MATTQIRIGKLKTFFLFLRGLFQRCSKMVVRKYATACPISISSVLTTTDYGIRHRSGKYDVGLRKHCSHTSSESRWTFFVIFKISCRLWNTKGQIQFKKKKDCQNLTNLRAVIIIKQRGHQSEVLLWELYKQTKM